jgi:3-oxoacyl-[acyl-carrier protein] reductase
MSPELSFADQTVVVTGGTRGLGRAMTLGFLEAGARVWATYHSSEEAARALLDQAGGSESRLKLARFDVGDYDATSAFWEQIEKQVPDGVQALVHNAGIRRDAVLAMMSLQDWSGVIDANLTGSFNMCKFGVQHMLRRRYGRIVLVTSPARDRGFEGQANYAASKAGQVGLMRCLAREVAKRGITVNCVSPGFIDTELIADLPEERRKQYLAQVPLRRFGRPEEVAYAVRALCAEQATYITGTTLEVAGGL